MQKSFFDLEYANKKKLTRRDRFLAAIDKATLWSKLHPEIERFYPKIKSARVCRLVWRICFAGTLPDNALACLTKASKTRSTATGDSLYLLKRSSRLRVKA